MTKEEIKTKKDEIIANVKETLKISDSFHDKDLEVKLNDTIAFLKPKGIQEEVALTKYPYIIQRGISDLFNHDNYTQLFNDMVVDAVLEEGTTNAQTN